MFAVVANHVCIAALNHFNSDIAIEGVFLSKS